MLIKISVIVPMYNSERWIGKCISSLLNQGLSSEEYEIIIVNDGSTDLSLSICQSYQKDNPNLIIVSQSNQGVSVARNRGIEIAKGDYICFVDSDDYIVENGLSYVMNHYSVNQYDVIRFWPTIVTNNISDDTCSGNIIFSGTGIGFIKKYGLETFCVNWLYKRQFLNDKEIRFSPLKMGEDFLFISTVLLNNPKLISTSSNIYRYIIHARSVTTTRLEEHSRQCVSDHLQALSELISKLPSPPQISDNESICKSDGILKNSFNGKMILIFSRILSANYTMIEYDQIIERCKRMDLLPICSTCVNIKYKICFALINILVNLPFLYRISSFLYRKLFIPYFLNHLNRNE